MILSPVRYVRPSLVLVPEAAGVSTHMQTDLAHRVKPRCLALHGIAQALVDHNDHLLINNNDRKKAWQLASVSGYHQVVWPLLKNGSA